MKKNIIVKVKLSLIFLMVVLFHMPLISQNYDVEIENGIKLIQSDRYDSAIIIFDNVLLNDSNNILALF